MSAIVSDATIALSKSEAEALRKLVEAGGEATLSHLSSRLGVPESSLHSLVELLRSKGLVEVIEREDAVAKVTEEGLSYLRDLFPEERVAEYLKERGGAASISEVKEALGAPVASIGLAWAIKRGWVSIEGGTVKLNRFEPLMRHRELLYTFKEPRSIPTEVFGDPVFDELKKRRLIKIGRIKIKSVKLAVPLRDVERILEAGVSVSRLTHEMIVTGAWRGVKLKPYNIEALPPLRYPGKKHFFKEFIEMLKEIMKSLGFEEVNDDYAIPELWNFDVLFQAQDHPSRDIHDVLMLGGKADLSDFVHVVERTRRVHEGGGGSGSSGWRYKWSLDKASNLILRSHTTAVTARFLVGREPPARLFTIARVFRRDNPDARHSPEFTNFDGVIMESGFNFRKLLGLLGQILRAIGIERYMFRPAYFPFTEPSVEGYGYVPGYGWIEVFGAGMFRPEVLEILGVRYPVGAWGMGVERLAMVIYGINDIRLLFSRDVEFLRRFPLIKVVARGSAWCQ